MEELHIFLFWKPRLCATFSLYGRVAGARVQSRDGEKVEVKHGSRSRPNYGEHLKQINGYSPRRMVVWCCMYIFYLHTSDLKAFDPDQHIRHVPKVEFGQVPPSLHEVLADLRPAIQWRHRGNRCHADQTRSNRVRQSSTDNCGRSGDGAANGHRNLRRGVES
jgi:hypothetical protein